MKPTPKTEPYPFHTTEERIVVWQIRVKALRYEKKLLKEAHRKGKLPTTDQILDRIIAAAWKSAEKKAPFHRSEKK